MKMIGWVEVRGQRRESMTATQPVIFSPCGKLEGLTGLQEALQLYRADELFPVVRPAGNDAQQLLGYDNTQRV